MYINHFERSITENWRIVTCADSFYLDGHHIFSEKGASITFGIALRALAPKLLSLISHAEPDLRRLRC